MWRRMRASYDPRMTSRRAPGGKPAGIIEVAQLAGVSRQTVTRAMNDMPGISAATKSRVLDAARTLHYRPSRFGRGLVNPGTPTLGLVVVDLTNTFFAQLASAILVAAASEGWTVLVAEEAHGGEAALVELSKQVDAVIGYLSLPDERVDRIFGALPVVLLDAAPTSNSRAAIAVDYRPGLEEGLRHLLAAGRRTIVMLDFSVTGTLSARGVAFNRLMADLGARGGAVLAAAHSEPDLDAGGQAVTMLFEAWPDLDAIVAFNDSVAIGTIKELGRRGVSVPQDVAVLGIDGLPIGRIITPELSSLHLDMRAVGETALHLVVGMWSGKLPLRGPKVHHQVSHTLLTRDSA